MVPASKQSISQKRIPKKQRKKLTTFTKYMRDCAQVSNGKRDKCIYILKFALLVIAYGLNGTTYTSIPFLFYRTQLKCLDSEGQSYQCSLEEACSSPYGYTEISQYPQLYSLTQHLDIYCDREIVEAWILTLANFGKLIAYVILLIFPIKKELKEPFMNICLAIVSVQLCLLEWIQTTEMFMVTFMVWYLFFNLFYGLIYTHVVESFPEDIQNYGAAYINMSWPSIMILYIIYSNFYGSWENSLVHFTGIPLLIISIMRIYLTRISSKHNSYQLSQDNDELQLNQTISSTPINKQIEDQYEIKTYLNQSILSEEKSYSQQLPEKQNKSDKFKSKIEVFPQNNENQSSNGFRKALEQFFPFMFKDQRLRTNFYIWTLGIVSNAISYVGCYFLLNLLQGNLFFNCLFSTVFEVFSTMIATFLVVSFQNKLKLVVQLTYLITGISFLSCLFIQNPQEQEIKQEGNTQQSFLQLLFQLFPVIIAKISFEITWTVLVSYQKYVIPTKYQQSQFSCSNLITVVCTNIVPFYKYFIVSLGYNPFIGFGILSLFASYFSRYYQEIPLDSKEYEDEDTTNKIEMEVFNSSNEQKSQQIQS